MKLLKTYQSEIDSLTKRAKIAESALGEFYRDLYQAPDPSPFLQQALSSEQVVSKQKFENAKLQTELKEFESEFAKLKNQDITIRELQDRITELEDELEKKAEVEEIANELQKEKMVEDEDLKREIDELNEALQRSEREALEQRKAAETAFSELYETKAQFEEKDASRQAEIDLLQDELTNARQAVQSESEVLRLRKLGVEEEERERKRREDELSRLYSALDAARVEASKAREAEAEAQRRREKEVEEMRIRGEERLQRERERIAELENLLSQNTEEKNGGRISQEELDGKEEEKNRISSSFETLVAQLRVALSEKEVLAEKYKTQLLNLEERINDQNELIRRLQQAELNSNGIPYQTSFTSAATSPTGEGSASNESVGVIGILQEQRDRFRRRMLELEQELESISGKEKRARELLDKSRSENAALADRVRGLRASQRIDSLSYGVNGSGGNTVAPGFRSPLQMMLRFVSAHSFARSALLFYIIALHLLVLLSLSSYGREEGIKATSLRRDD